MVRDGCRAPTPYKNLMASSHFGQEDPNPSPFSENRRRFDGSVPCTLTPVKVSSPPLQPEVEADQDTNATCAHHGWETQHGRRSSTTRPVGPCAWGDCMNILKLVLPGEVRSCEVRGNLSTLELTSPFRSEQEIISKAGANRQREFNAGRHCAHMALKALGRNSVPILSSSRGAPIWPQGVVGSITHSTQYVAAAAADNSRIIAIGIDAEPNEPLRCGVQDLIVSSSEKNQIENLTTLRPEVEWGRVFFSAKESVYKAWFSLTQSWLGFDDVDLNIDIKGSIGPVSYRSSSHRAHEVVAQLSGRWAVKDGIIVTAIFGIDNKGHSGSPSVATNVPVF